MARAQIHLGRHGPTFATRERARAIVQIQADDFGSSVDVVDIDLRSVEVMSPSFCDELVAAVQDAWPNAAIRPTGPDHLVERLGSIARRRHVELVAIIAA